MKKQVKIVISLILTVSLLLSCAITGFAEKDKGSDKVVAEISIMSCMYSNVFSGHTWFYVKNLSNKPIQVGLYTVPVGQGVSIGSFAFTARDGFGVYYNLEAYRENVKDNENTHWSITKRANAEELKKFSDDVASYVNYWTFYFNCAFFTFSIWNKNSDNFFIPLVLPVFTQAQLKAAGAKQGAVDMFYPKTNQIFRQKGSGKKAVLVPVSQSTIEAGAH